MTREEKIKKIYTTIMKRKKNIICRDCLFKRGLKYPWRVRWVDGKCSQCWIDEEDVGLEIATFQWWKCLIGSIFEWYSFSKWFINSQFITKLIDKWTGYDKSIDDQSDDCIDFIYSLIKKQDECSKYRI